MQLVERDRSSRAPPSSGLREPWLPAHLRSRRAESSTNPLVCPHGKTVRCARGCGPPRHSAISSGRNQAGTSDVEFSREPLAETVVGPTPYRLISSSFFHKMNIHTSQNASWASTGDAPPTLLKFQPAEGSDPRLQGRAPMRVDCK